MNTKNTDRNKSIMKALKSIHGFRDKMDIQKQRRSQETLGLLFSPMKGIVYETFKIDDMPVEWLHKDKSNDNKHIILYFHGGAYLTGNLVYARILGAKLAACTEIDVLTIDYRLAPENPFPAALEDATRAWNYLINKGYKSDNIAIVGESAGGNLVLSLANYLKQNNEPLPAALVCMSPWIDFLDTGKSRITKKEFDPMLTDEFLNEAKKAYACNNDLADPLISPIYGNFKGFPPTFIQVGTNEILLSDSITLKNRLTKSNVDCYIEIWSGMWHVFQMFPIRKANRAIQNTSIFLISKLQN